MGVHGGSDGLEGQLLTTVASITTLVNLRADARDPRDTTATINEFVLTLAKIQNEIWRSRVITPGNLMPREPAGNISRVP
jgi:hypothetical protein